MRQGDPEGAIQGQQPRPAVPPGVDRELLAKRISTMAWSRRLRNRAAALWKTEIQRVSTARTIEAILVAIAVREETESRQTSGLCSRNECDRGAEKPSRIS